MNAEKKQQARNLFFQTELTKTQIANTLGISRRTLTYWISEGNWNRLKQAANHLPSILAENCYHIIGHLTESYLSERRLTNPVTNKEIDGLHKLAITVNKLKNRSTLNESMEMLGYFMDGVYKKNPQLAVELAPYVDEYLSSRAAIYATTDMPQNFTGINGRIPWLPEDNTESLIDAREAFFSDPGTIEAYKNAGMELPSEEEISTLPDPTPAPPPYTLDQRNADRLAALQEWQEQKDAATPTPEPYQPPRAEFD